MDGWVGDGWWDGRTEAERGDFSRKVKIQGISSLPL
jgi:hypothetical protein